MRERAGSRGALPSWLTESWERPREFFAALASEADHVLGIPAKSQLHAGIDWYTDSVLRHLPRRSRHALRFHDPANGWQTLTLAELDARASRLAAALAARGVAQSDRVALVLPGGLWFCIGQLALLRLGCCVIPIQPLGGAYIRSLLGASNPKRVISCFPYTALQGLAQHDPILLSPELLTESAEPPRIATYRPESPMFLVRSPLRDPEQLTAVSAGDAYAAALRDGLLVFALRPGECLLGPTSLPALSMLFLAALLCGAGFMELSEESARHDAALVKQEPARAALLSRATRDVLLESAQSAEGGAVRWSRWFRDPQEPLDAAEWQQLRLLDIPHGNLIWDPAAAGAVLCSPPRPGPLDSRVAPAAGCRHRLAALSGDGPALTELGRFVLIREDGKPAGAPGEALLLRRADGPVYAGARLPRRAGCSYPISDVLALLGSSGQIPGLVGASVVELAGGAPQAQALVVLILFCGLQPTERISIEACTAFLERELGPGARPDRVEVFPLFPRRTPAAPEGSVDHAWVRDRYLTGELHRKGGIPVFTQLTRARAALLQGLTELR